MECFLPGAGSTGFWAVLEPVFGAGAFDAGGHRLEQWLDARTPEAMSFFLDLPVHDVHRRWGSVFWRSWARVIRGRLPAIGRPNAEILHHGPPPAYARGQAAVGGAEPWPQVHPGIPAGGARRGGPVSGARRPRAGR